MSTTSDDSYVEMEAGTSPEAKKEKKPKKPAGPPDYVGEKLVLIECACLLLIGISSYTIVEANLAGGGRYLKNDDKQNNDYDDAQDNDYKEKKNWKDHASLFLASTLNATLLNYSLGVGVVTLLMCMAIRVIEKCRPGTLIAPRSFFGKTGFTIEKILAVFNALWWLAGTAVMTFKGPYVDASNG